MSHVASLKNTYKYSYKLQHNGLEGIPPNLLGAKLCSYNIIKFLSKLAKRETIQTPHISLY